MMKKAGAGMLRSIMGLCLIGGCWLSGNQAAQGQTQSADTEVIDFKAKVQARINNLKGRPAEEIEQAILRSEEKMKALNTEAQASRMAIRELQEKMRLENPEVRAMYAEIDAMRVKINEYIDQLPEVKAQVDKEKDTSAQLMEEVWFRTEAMRVVAVKDRAAGFPEREEAVLDESETAVIPEPKEDLEP